MCEVRLQLIIDLVMLSFISIGVNTYTYAHARVKVHIYFLSALLLSAQCSFEAW